MTGESVWGDGAKVRADAESEHSKLEDELLPLFRSLSEGHLEALAMVYDICSRQVYGFALWKMGCEADATDVVQEVFVRLATRSSTLHNVRRPFPYILQIAHRVSCDIFRNRRREVSQASNLILAVFLIGWNPGFPEISPAEMTAQRAEKQELLETDPTLSAVLSLPSRSSHARPLDRQIFREEHR